MNFDSFLKHMYITHPGVLTIWALCSSCCSSNTTNIPRGKYLTKNTNISRIQLPKKFFLKIKNFTLYFYQKISRTKKDWSTPSAKGRNKWWNTFFSVISLKLYCGHFVPLLASKWHFSSTPFIKSLAKIGKNQSF